MVENDGACMNLLMAMEQERCNFTPIYTKKNRRPYTLTVICKESEREKLENLIFQRHNDRYSKSENGTYVTILTKRNSKEGYTGRNSNCKSVHIPDGNDKILSGI